MMNEKYRLVMTADGTYTLFNNSLNETMHTISGAYEESLVKHVNASGILGSKMQKIRILDIGFGLGYNILAAWSELEKRNSSSNLEIVSLERDRSFGEWIGKISFDDDRRDMYDKVKEAYFSGEYSEKGISIKVAFGEARSIVRKIAIREEPFDAVFQDAYSPGKNPELWTCDYFCVIRSLMKSSAVLTTYSAAPQVRMALMKAGFKVGKAESTGMKKEGTIASAIEVKNELTNEEKNALMGNIKSTVYRDETLSDTPGVILNRRIREMEYLREDRRAHPE